MSPYFATASARFRVQLQYRAAALAGATTQIVWGFLRLMIFTAFYASSTGSHPMSLAQTVTYVWLGQALFAMLPWRPDAQLRADFRSGNVAYEMLRPVDVYWIWFSRNLATLVAPTLMRVGPVLLVGFLFGGLGSPASPAAAAATLVTVGAGFLLGCALLTALTATFFWTVAGRGITLLNMAVLGIFTGLVVPLPLFPDWLRAFVGFLPFRGLMDTPFRFYMGNLPPSALLPALTHQFLWIVAFVLLGKALVARGGRHLVVQGG